MELTGLRAAARETSDGGAYCTVVCLLRMILETTIPIIVIARRPAQVAPTPMPIFTPDAFQSVSTGVADGFGVLVVAPVTAVVAVVRVDVVDGVGEAVDAVVDGFAFSGAFTVV
jgi:hypothetical protein